MDMSIFLSTMNIMSDTALRLPRQVHLFGALRIQDEQGLRALAGEKPQHLLAYLILHPNTPHSRERLAELLFPDASIERVPPAKNVGE